MCNIKKTHKQQVIIEKSIKKITCFTSYKLFEKSISTYQSFRASKVRNRVNREFYFHTCLLSRFILDSRSRCMRMCLLRRLVGSVKSHRNKYYATKSRRSIWSVRNLTLLCTLLQLHAELSSIILCYSKQTNKKMLIFFSLSCEI